MDARISSCLCQNGNLEHGELKAVERVTFNFAHRSKFQQLQSLFRVASELASEASKSCLDQKESVTLWSA